MFDGFLERSGKKGEGNRDDVQMLLSGSGLENLFEFFASHVYPVGCSQLYPNLRSESVPLVIRAEDVCALAKKELAMKGEGDIVSLKTLEHFMRYFARFLADMACVFMPFGGIYLMSTVVYET